MPRSYRQESTLPEAEPFVGEWEKILAQFGLSDGQCNKQDIITLVKPTDFTPRIPDHHGEWMGEAAEVENDEMSQLHRVRQRFTSRAVPWWANDDKLIAEFLLFKHPGIRNIGTGKEAAQRCRAARDRAARDAARIYLAFRAGWHDQDIADLLGVSVDTIIFQLWEMRGMAEKFFAKQNRAVGVTDFDVRVHFCHRPGFKKPVSCRCKRWITLDEATRQVDEGLADWDWVYPPKGQAFQSRGAIVLIPARKTPRSATLEKAHIERAASDYKEQQASTAAYLQLEFEKWSGLIVPFIADPFEGRAMLYRPGDSRTSVGDTRNPT
jgi:hypothetical protein